MHFKNLMSQQNDTPFLLQWFYRVMITIGFMTTTLILLTLFSPLNKEGVEGNVAHLKLFGPITATAEEASLISDTQMIHSGRIIEVLEEIQEDPTLKGILLEINSPGGTPVASAEIAAAIRECPLPTVAWIREVGASGAYWIAASSDHIVAHPMSITGSIGVLANHFGFEDFLSRWDIKYRRQVAGPMKDVGDPFRSQSEEENTYIQSVLDAIHQEFIDAVGSYRQMDEGWHNEAANGLFFTGIRAKEIKLIDTLGSRKEAVQWLETTLDEPVTLEEFLTQGGFLDSLLYGIQTSWQKLGEGVGLGLSRGFLQSNRSFLPQT